MRERLLEEELRWGGQPWVSLREAGAPDRLLDRPRELVKVRHLLWVPPRRALPRLIDLGQGMEWGLAEKERPGFARKEQALKEMAWELVLVQVWQQRQEQVHWV